MKKSAVVLIIVIAVVLVLGIYLVSAYNRFISLEQKVDGSWSEVENQYQRQADLIPNLISVVSSSVSVETKFVKDVIEARTKFQGANTQTAKDTAGVQMANSVATFVSAVAEGYPVLQANTQYVALTDELSGTQNRITTARGRYIEAIGNYNIATKRFPAKLVAGMFGFEGKDYYHAEVSALQTPELGTGQLPQ